MPVIRLTRRLVLAISSVTMRVSAAKTSLRVRRAITTSSSAAFPARSPIPLIVHSTCPAPAATAPSELAVERPRSLWQCTEMTARAMLGTRCWMARISCENSWGVA